MAQRTVVIANPRSRNGATGRRWQRVAQRIRDALGEFEVGWTQGPRDAERLAREAVSKGCERLVVAGGDGTLSEVATGLLAADLGARVEIALLPMGTGGDFGRAFGIPRDLDAALRCIAAGAARPVDAGRLHFVGGDGAPRTAYFVNVASIGISALIDDLVNRSTKSLGGTASFLIGTLRAIARYRSQPVRLRVDGTLVHEGPLLLAAAANGRQFGGGMRIAPDARPDDGLLDVVIVRDLPVRALLPRLPRLYTGTHLRDPAVALHRGRVIEADAERDAVPLELDGEALGRLPARIELLPGALRIVGPPQ